MSYLGIELVCLHRCKLCDVRMFARDRAGHLCRHGIDFDDIAEHFQPGDREIPLRVGASYKPLQAKKGKGGAKR